MFDLRPRLFTARAYRPGAFTLLEVVLALTLMVTMLAGVYEFYQTSLRARYEGGQIARDAILTRWILERMAEEIRHTTDVVPGDGIGFKGTYNKITIVYRCLPERYAFNRYDSIAEDRPPAQLDLRRITYELLWDEELEDDEGVKICHGLWRSEQRTFDPNPTFVLESDETNEELFDEEGKEGGEQATPQIQGELIAPEIKFLEFEYFDGAEWRDRWQVAYEQPGTEDTTGQEGEVSDTPAYTGVGEGGYALPQAVKITVGQVRVPPEDQEFDITQLRQTKERREKEVHHPDRFTIVVNLIQADQTLLSSRKYGLKNQPNLQLGGSE